MSELSTVVLTIINQQADPRSALEEIMDAARAAGITGGSAQTAPSCGCGYGRVYPEAKYNKMRTILKLDAPGYTNQSLAVTVKSLGDRDVLVVNGANEFRRMYKEIPVTAKSGKLMRLDRNSVRVQLRLGVLKITGRTYTTDTPIAAMDLGTRTYSPVMMPNA